MGVPKNRISSIGLELEGGWDGANVHLKRDGSVVFSSPMPTYVGEVASPPIATSTEATSWLRNNYPQHVNNTCGFHVHVCLPPLHYSRLMDENFNNKFLGDMELFWSKYRGQPGFELFRYRLEGQNRYCQKVFRPEQQLWQTAAYGDLGSTPRYSQLNYCFGRHGTLECRLFPCFPSVEHSIEGMLAFVGSINSFLSTCKADRPIQFSVTGEDSLPIVDNRPARVPSVQPV